MDHGFKSRARGTDYIHVFVVGVAVSEGNSIAADQKAYQIHWGEKVDKTIIWLVTCSSVLCILTTIKTLLYKITIQSATCFDPLAVIIRLISKTCSEVYVFFIIHCNIIICSAYKTAHTDVCKTYCTIPVYTTVFLKMNLQVWRM
jgi:hypothetical protein